MKSVNFTDLIETYCQLHNCYAVRIDVDQFWNESTSNFDPEYDSYINRVCQEFEKDQARDILSTTLNSELCVFETEQDAMALYRIMEEKEFESKYYACIYGPKGAITENT
jgi:hypothetical protein